MAAAEGVSIGDKIKDFKVLTLLGKGSFACVYKAKSVSTGVEVAIKMIDKKIMHKVGMVQRIRNEVEIHCQLKHPSILELYNYFEDNNYVYLVLEMCHNGEMSRYLKNRKAAFSEDESRHLMHQIVTGMLYLHSHGILHRDLTLSNLLLTGDMNVKIADFGLAAQLKMPNEKHFTMCGTPNYISPEIATHSAHGLESDVWSLGCMFYTFLVGMPPFDTDTVKNTLNKVMLADYEMPNFISKEAQDLICQLLRKNPADRISLSGVLDHAFMIKCSLSRNKDLGNTEDSMDSGHATISTAFTAGTGSGISSMGRLHQKTKHIIGQCLPNKMAVITSQNKITSASSSMEGISVFNERGAQRVEVSKGGRGRTVKQTEEERPHSRWLRRAHSTDRSGTSQHHILGKPDNMERSHSVEALTKSARPGIYSPADISRDTDVWPFCTGAVGSFGSDGTCRISPPVKQTANPNFAYQHISNVLPLKQTAQADAAQQWFENAQVPNGTFKKPVDVSSLSNASGSFLSGRRHQIQNEAVLVKAWGKNPVSKFKTDPLHRDHFNKQTIQRCEQVPLKHPRQGDYRQPDAKYDTHPVSKQEHSVQSEMQHTEYQMNALCDKVSPLRAHRLKPIRQRTKNAVVSILDTEEVCMELLKGSGAQERVKEVLRISCDGYTIHIYHPNEGRGFPLDDRPPSAPEDVYVYHFDNLPEKFWKKYQYASKFVHLVRSKTPKVTLYTKYAKCMLMENGPKADVEVLFYDGGKINKTTEFLRIVEKSGKSYTFDGGKLNGLNEEAKIYVEHAHKAHQTCLELESTIAAQEKRKEKQLSFFPIIIGRRPSSTESVPSVSRSVEPQCIVQEQPMILDNYSSSQSASISPFMYSYEGSDFTTATTVSKMKPSSPTQTVKYPNAAQVLKSVFVPNVGWASQLTNGEVWVQFNDGSQLFVQSGVTSIIYTSPQGQIIRYGENEKIPEYVKEKLQCLSSILGLLASERRQQRIQ
ncbi:serine/threonine-protein kinase PLK4 isoform X2 [Callorhinchus milii]|uniref:serine/threonine-protein kinase PLK4 isoform X2 n=1 Tax=Callorhinchus milii TaxID=7868 RepID=UPI000457267A|nr:serine/threonine-protein kinase PLK4 isoform X2 [Callorhinchus milii]|eukprot:gi/632983905/ref/XP_007908878.1/ PREDICTED: serine/threonine-protein kinase PLK4 isoform X2 [Callorhinchus milii]